MKKLLVILLSSLILVTMAPFAQAASFKDVSRDNTFYNDINSLVGYEIIQGFPDGTFRPNANVTRAQAAIMIGRSLGLDGTRRDSKIFSDVNSYMTASGYIQSAVDLGIIRGFEDGTFRPEEVVTRGQLAIFLARAFELTETTKINFTDVTVNMASYTHISSLVAANITVGYNDGTFRPNAPVTRGQFSAFMSRTIDYLLSDLHAYKVSEEEKEVLRLVNIEREKAGVAPLQLHEELSYVARVKSQDFSDYSYFDHTSPNYGTPFEMLKEFGFNYRSAGENIAMGYRTPEQVVDGWMNSTGHRANILSEAYTHLGVGYVEDGNYWTQLFLTP